jgi:predicted metal-dependent hydrolase
VTTAHLALGDISLDVTFKDIKNVHLSVHPPFGKVTISAPATMRLDRIRAFAATKIRWIRLQQRKLRAANRAPQFDYVERESHYVWGQRYLLHITSDPECEEVTLSPKRFTLRVPESADAKARYDILAMWYRKQVRSELPSIITKLAKALGVSLPRVHVRQMKTKWGSCNHRTGSIIVNTDLAKKPRACLEYVLLHEMAHLIEPTHNDRFSRIMDRIMPTWQSRRDLLNSFPAPTLTEGVKSWDR